MSTHPLKFMAACALLIGLQLYAYVRHLRKPKALALEELMSQ